VEQSLHIPDPSIGVAIVVALLAIGALFLYVQRIRGAATRRDRILLTTLRFLVVGGVLFAWLQPSLRVEEVLRRKSTVPILIDESLSMEVLDGEGQSRAERVAAFFRNHRDWLDELEENHEVRYFAFSDNVRPLTRADIEAPLPPIGGATDLEAALTAIRKDIPDPDLGGILVFSDGRDTGRLAQSGPAGKPLLRSVSDALRIPVPLHLFLPAPEPAGRPDAAVADVAGLEYVLARNLTEVRCRVATAGTIDGPLAITLSSEGRILDRASIAVGKGVDEHATILRFLPTLPGRHLLEVSVTGLDSDPTPSDNVRLVLAEVVRDHVRILHVAGHASWDVRFLGEALRSRRDIEMVSFHTLRTSAQEESIGEEDTMLVPFPAEEIFVKRLDGFDLVILHNYELPDVDRNRFAGRITGYVEQGGALLFIGGSASLGARAPWPAHLDPVLPVRAPDVSGRGLLEGRFAIEMTRDGLRFPWSRAPGLTERVRGAPPVRSLNPVGAIAPDATVLLQALPDLDGATQKPLPVLVLGDRGQGRVAAVLTDTLWRWAFDPTSQALYRETLHGLIGSLTRDPRAYPLQVAAVFPYRTPRQDQRIRIEGPPGAGSVQVQFQKRGPDGVFESVGDRRETTLDMRGEAEIQFIPRTPGAFKVLVRLEEGHSIMEASDLFVVGPSAAELATLGSTDDPGMFRVASSILPLEPPSPETLSLRPEVVARLGVFGEMPLWNHPVLLILLLAILAFEWYFERRIGYT
jgi:uncharacterized membrane protein